MVDLLARLVEPERWRNLLKMPCDELRVGMEARSLRGLRPDADDSFERGFDVDIEAELLDWMDFHDFVGDGPLLESVCVALESGAEPERLASGLWQLADWASPGTWRCMEGRGFLYIEPYSGGPLDGVSQLYEEATWGAALGEIYRMDADDYAEKVVLDWMARRQDLDETLDEKQDPRILSTMQSHRRHSTALHRLAGILDAGKNGEGGEGLGVALLVCREWHSMLNVGWGEFNLRGLLMSGWGEESP
jgi:hypothetical protein